MTVESTNLPSELIQTPIPLIGLAGLDIIKNPTHKSIWDAFNNNRKPDRAAIQFKLLAMNYDFPISKPKRQSYEWYHPKGILKRNWMLKHLHVLPAVVVLFQDIEWNDPKWTEKQLQCASLIQSLKNSLQGRNTKLAIVLLQKGSPLPPGEDMLASERAANLTNVCDLNAKMLFVLPHNDHLMGYTLRLEAAFLDLAQTYYTQMAKQIRSHRDQLTASHQILKIRHQFKLGFISEMKLDFSTASKHYIQAYQYLDEIRIVDTNCLEIKTVAGFFNYKICKLMFKLNVPRDSITNFKNHIDKYKSRPGFKELLFEHYAWLSVQYSAFAELFCEAIKNGLPALQIQHPGIYYHKAAEYIGKRKEAFLQTLSLSPTEQSPTTPAALYSDFFGYRGTKSGEPVSEQQIISLVQINEKKFNHSMAVITLLGQAMAQFKVYKCLRFRKKLAVDMAEEYLNSGDYSKALTLYSLMLPDYRVDKWYSIFTQVLLKTLRSAYLSASVNDFISCSIEALSGHILIETNERINYLENLWKVYENVPPVSQSQIAPELRINWENSLTNFITPIQVNLDNLCDLLESKITFTKRQIDYDETVQIILYIRTNTTVPLKMRKFSVIVTDSKNNFKLNSTHYCEYGTQIPENLIEITEFLMEPNKCYKILFSGEQYQFVENVEVQIVRLEIEMGSDKNFAILTMSSSMNKILPFKPYNPHSDSLENIQLTYSCYIIPIFHLSTQTKQNNQPMLVNEYYKMTTNINNSFDVCLKNVGISITIPPNLRNKVFLTTDLTKPMQKLCSHVQMDVGELQLQSCTSISYYVTSLVEGNIELKQRIWYQTDRLRITAANDGIQAASSFKSIVDSPTSNTNDTKSITDSKSQKFFNNHSIKIEYMDDDVKKLKEDVVIVSCIDEIKFIGRFYTLSRQALMRAYKNEDFLLRINMEVKASCEIDILDTYFICDHNLIEKPYKGQKKLCGNNLKNGQILQDIKILNSSATSSEWITKADYLRPENILIFENKLTEKTYTPNTMNANKQDDNLLNMKNFNSKLPLNSTIIGNTMSNSQNLSTSGDEQKMRNIFDIPGGSVAAGNPKNDDQLVKNLLITKNIFNNAIDSVYLTNNDKCGFFNVGGGSASGDVNNVLPIFGMYCVKWKRSNANNENESKFIINGIEIIKPQLNIYCNIEKKLYVRVPMTLKIQFKNPTKRVIHLLVMLNSSDNFMFAGHRQLNISIFSYSTYELQFNLYPLKAGWQELPKLHLEYNCKNFNTQCDTESKHPDDVNQNVELINLVKRWMPKMVFIHPPTRHLE